MRFIQSMGKAIPCANSERTPLALTAIVTVVWSGGPRCPSGLTLVNICWWRNIWCIAPEPMGKEMQTFFNDHVTKTISYLQRFSIHSLTFSASWSFYLSHLHPPMWGQGGNSSGRWRDFSPLSSAWVSFLLSFRESPAIPRRKLFSATGTLYCCLRTIPDPKIQRSDPVTHQDEPTPACWCSPWKSLE